MLIGYYRLGRPINALAGCLLVLLSAYAANPVSWWPVIMAAITVLLITVSTNAWNDYVDIEIDKVNKPHRPLPSGQVTPANALLFSIGGTFFSLVAAVFINQPAFIIALASNILLYLYSWKLKCSVLWGNIAVATITALCVIFGGVAAGNIQPVITLSVTVFFAILGREILKTMADYEGDFKENCRTIAVAWGKKKARTYVLIFLAIAIVMIIAVYFIEQYKPAYLLISLILVCPVIFYVALNSKATMSDKELEKSSTIMKYAFFIWFLAVALGAG